MKLIEIEVGSADLSFSSNMSTPENKSDLTENTVDEVEESKNNDSVSLIMIN